ncbi:hypothetical protein [Azospirillum argentinense]|uniref:hypothetical protein n=1 Tax=Azospirillum argentinense TaxID=2970906 RepID=UPI0010C050DA|nr:hypothetical protein [Azospirillum argentinense]
MSDLVISSPLPILLVFPDSLTVAFLNQRAADLLGPSRSTAIGARLPDLIDLGEAGDRDVGPAARRPVPLRRIPYRTSGSLLRRPLARS